MDSGPHYMSFLSRYSNNGNPSNPTSLRVLPKGNPPPTNIKAPKAQNGSATTTSTTSATKPPNTTTLNGTYTANKPNPPTTLKRKAEEELARPAKAGEVTRNGATTSAAKPSTSSTTTKPTTPGSTASAKPSDSVKPAEVQPAKVPKKGSYLDILQRAKSATLTKKPPAGAIINKPRPPPERKEKEWQRKFAEERAAKARGERISKSPGVGASGEKPKSISEKGAIGRKDVGSSAVKKSSVPEKRAVPPTSSVPSSKASRPDVKSRLTTGPVREKEPVAPKRGRPPRPSTYDRDWERDHRRPRTGGPRYIYREDSYDSDSDMEAAGIDILEEEERSSKAAIKEDLEQERLEKRLAAEKAARKRGLK